MLLMAVIIAALPSAVHAGQVRLTGILEYETSYGIPHYSVLGYVLVGADPTKLQAMRGTEVVVEGVELTDPSVFMTRAVRVDRLAPKEPPAEKESGSVTTPVAPDPAFGLPRRGGTITLPSPPPLFGTPYHVLFGRIVADNGRYFLQGELGTYSSRSEIASQSIRLEALVGEQIGAVAERESLSDGQWRFHIREAVVVTQDLAEHIQSRAGSIYIPPVGEVTVRLRGRMVHLDQAPVIGNSRTLVGLRAIAEAMGAQVEWEGATQSVRVILGSRQVLVRVGSNVVIIRENGQETTLVNDIAPVIIGGRTMVPARVLAEGLGLTVGWSPETRTVILD